MRRALLALLLLPALSGCRYAYVPLIPPVAQPQLPVRVFDVNLVREGEEVVVRAQVAGRFEPGYLSVQWFRGQKRWGQMPLLWMPSSPARSSVSRRRSQGPTAPC
ncbi:hypothetical protein ACFP81_00715 [Deinococcus lacus]|uniref:Ig-like domain-containing protein n=1 Tax=Deinococcus lacus TaxID=392561 RepID=A0ABW1Y9P3_9DEIO